MCDIPTDAGGGVMEESALNKLKGWNDRPCLGTDLELWYGPANDLSPNLRETRDQAAFRMRAAQAVCAGCPVQAECLESELVRPLYEQHGVRGGKTARQRQALIRERRRQAAAPLPVREVA